MDTLDSETWLSAADCAARTGLTVRALRLYEELGLISPRRSAGGWRQYGPHELVKLNQVALLKTAGLSLGQICVATCSDPTEPTLQQILENQLDVWKRKRTDAQRGQAIAEAALNRLRSAQSLSVDELCNLIRGLEMTQSQTDTTRDFAWATVHPTVLDTYTGSYRHHHQVIKVWRDGQRLLTDALTPGSLGTVELHPVSQTEFYPTHGGGYFQYRFLQGSDGAVSALSRRVQGVESTFPRIDAVTAHQLREKLRERFETQRPLEGSQAALRHLVEGIRDGQPPYEEMSPEFSQVIKLQLPLLQPITAELGALGSIEFRGVGKDGWDQYDVHRERGSSRWGITLSAQHQVLAARLDWDRPSQA
jgi:DNA-binding transcriptional MerR regulator